MGGVERGIDGQKDTEMEKRTGERSEKLGVWRRGEGWREVVAVVVVVVVVGNSD